MMKAKKKRLLETCHWLVEKSRQYWSFAAVPAAAAASEVLLLFGIINEPKVQKQDRCAMGIYGLWLANVYVFYY